MKNVSKALLAVAAVAVPGIVLGENPAWTYGQVGYYRADSGDDATDGFRVKGSLGFAENFHFQAEYIDGSIGIDSGPDLDFDGYQVVLGANPSVGENTDAVAAIRYFDVSYDVTGGDDDVDGFGLGVGVRHMLASNVELNGIAWWNEGNEDFGSSDEDFSDISLEIGGRYLFTENFSAGVTVVTNDSIGGGDSATIDLRWQFDDLL
jgi:hypothetical protein